MRSIACSITIHRLRRRGARRPARRAPARHRRRSARRPDRVRRVAARRRASRASAIRARPTPTAPRASASRRPAAAAGFARASATTTARPGGTASRSTLADGSTVNLCIPTAAILCERCGADDQCPGGACLAHRRRGPVRVELHRARRLPDRLHLRRRRRRQPPRDVLPAGDRQLLVHRRHGRRHPERARRPTRSGPAGAPQTCDPATGWSACDARTPATETCNGVDDDCNYVIDDGVGGGEACDITNGFGTCTGVRSCDGASGFVCVGQTPAAEMCNFLDDDCDGKVDEDFTDLGTVCSAGVGACLRYGSMQCNVARAPATVCTAVAGHGDRGAVQRPGRRLRRARPTRTSRPSATAAPSAMGVCARQGTVICDRRRHRHDLLGDPGHRRPGPRPATTSTTTATAWSTTASATSTASTTRPPTAARARSTAPRSTPARPTRPARARSPG